MTVRKIVKIDESRCNGCGLCVPACAEGALQIIDGKARLVSEVYCDGLGACLGKCPQDAIKIEEREAPGFDEAAVRQHPKKETEVRLPCGCPGTTATAIEREEDMDTLPKKEAALKSQLRNFPVQLTLVPPAAPFLNGTDLLLASDCVPFCYAGFHEDFLKGHTLLIACPKLDDFEAHKQKLTEILRKNQLKSLTVLRMEVPCCSGLTYLAEQALQASGNKIPFREIVIGIHGNVKEG